MKTPFILLIVLLFWIKVQGQEKVVLYYNSNWQLTQKEKAVYYREGEYDLNQLRLNGHVADFNVGGQKLMEGNYTDGKREGEFTFFFANGKMDRKGIYENNRRIGKWEYFYPNGKLKQLVMFYPTDGIENFVVVDYFDRQGKQLVKSGTGKWVNDSILGNMFNPLDFTRLTGQYKDSLKVGNWKLIRISDKKLIHSEQFSKGYFSSAVVFSPHSNEYGTVDSEMLNKLPDNWSKKFKSTETFQLDSTVFADSLFNTNVPSTFKTLTGKNYEIKNRRVMYFEGDAGMLEFLGKNITYPINALKDRKSGKVYVEAMIDSKGNLTEAKILYGVDKDLDNEALRVVWLITKWLPALQDGVAVQSSLIIPVTFNIRE